MYNTEISDFWVREKVPSIIAYKYSSIPFLSVVSNHRFDDTDGYLTLTLSFLIGEIQWFFSGQHFSISV